MISENYANNNDRDKMINKQIDRQADAQKNRHEKQIWDKNLGRK